MSSTVWSVPAARVRDTYILRFLKDAKCSVRVVEVRLFKTSLLKRVLTCFEGKYKRAIATQRSALWYRIKEIRQFDHERKANRPASGSRRLPIEAEMSCAASIENVIPLPP
jgi:hypothetical protein